ncbi:MAG: peptidylprolyl isomerase [Flavobacteriaceae bacterium]|nr:peptidylprolyl isomerase [Flavobacteriaceae bacterium]
MAILGKIREKSIVLILVIGMALFAFVISGVFDGAGTMSQEPVAIVGDEEVNIEQFSRRVDAVERNTGMSNVQAVNTVWDQVVTEYSFNQLQEELGLAVGRGHVENFISNSPGFRQDSRFQNALGEFDIVAFTDFINDSKRNSPEIYRQWQLQEESIQNSISKQLYTTMVRAGIYHTEFDGKGAHALENDKISISYVKVPYSSIPDSLVTVTDRDIKIYINTHSADFEVEASRSIRYVVFDEEASVEDNLAIENELKKLLEPQIIFNAVSGSEETLASFSQTDNVQEFIAEYSEVPYAETYQTKAQLGTYANTLFELKEGEVFGPYKDGSQFKLSRMMDVDRGGSVKARHILFAYTGSQSASSEVTRTKAEARREAYRVLRLARAKGADFAELARTYSDGPSKNRGGDLGFFRRGDMVEAFNDYAFAKPIGSTGVVETDFGYHIIEVQEKEDVVLIASVVKKIVPSEVTSNEVFRKATQFEIDSKKNGFKQAAESSGNDPRSAAGLSLMEESIPGLGSQRAIVKWAFEEETRLNDIKRFDLMGGGYVVAELTDVTTAGTSSAVDVQNRVRPILLQDKKYELLVSKYRENATLATLADDYGQTISTSSAVNAAAGSIAGAGTEPFVVGLGFSLQMKETSALIKGKQGVFVLEVDFFEKATPLRSYEGYSSSLSEEVINRLRPLIDEVIREQYEVVDNRFDYF